MTDKQKQLSFTIQMHEQAVFPCRLKEVSKQIRIQDESISRQELNSQNQVNSHRFKNSKQQKNKNNKNQKKCLITDVCRRQMLRIVFIPLLIVLFLLTIALTFKQNNYQTNDYFYSKNIQINRKIRGVVPPLNQSKQQIFGMYRIGLVQSFNIENRRMFNKYIVEINRNEQMKIVEEDKDNKCWCRYRLKFYSSTIFIQKIQSHLSIIKTTSDNKNNTIVSANNQSNTAISNNRGNQQLNNSQDNTIKQNKLNSLSSSNSFNSSNSNQTIIKNNQSDNQKIVNDNPILIHQQQVNNGNTFNNQQNNYQQQSICSIQLWNKLNLILSQSHIWTSAQNNFYLLKFSQLTDQSNGVLILKLIQRYPKIV